MGAYTKAKPHLSREEVMERIKNTRGFREVQKLLVVLNAIVDPRSAYEIAQHTGLAEQTVHNFISEYNRKGPEVFEKPGRGGRRNAYLTLEEEKELLAGFEPDGLTGRIATDAQIKAEFERRAGREVSRSTIYRMLARHGWRKVVPRPAHVEKDADKQEAFKKNSRKKSKRSVKKSLRKTTGR
jgi:transposase